MILFILFTPKYLNKFAAITFIKTLFVTLDKYYQLFNKIPNKNRSQEWKDFT